MTANPSVQIWDIEKLIPYENNAKVHDEEQVSKLAKSIEKFGWTSPISVWKNGEIIGGHGRRLAAIKLGLKKVPVIVRDDLTKAEADALRLADNRVASTEYDSPMIQDELRRLSEELEGADFELSDMGFDEKELEFSLSDLGEMNDDFFVDDVSGAVEEQRQENENSVDETDQTAAPIGDALGFKRITIEESREIRNLMSQIQPLSGKEGVEALIWGLKEAIQ